MNGSNCLRPPCLGSGSSAGRVATCWPSFLALRRGNASVGHPLFVSSPGSSSSGEEAVTDPAHFLTLRRGSAS